MAVRSRSLFLPLALIAVGAYFLLARLGWLPSLSHWFNHWWPVALIALGVLLLLRRLS